MPARSKPESSTKIKRLMWRTAPLLLTLLTGCAGQMAYREGRDLVAQNRMDEGLQKFNQAMQEAPRSSEFRAAWMQTRDRITNQYLQQAQNLLNKDPEQARSLFLRVLAIQADNTRAISGLAQLDAAKRHLELFQQARQFFEKKETILAKQKLEQILLENPQHANALQLQREIAAQTTQAPLQAQLAAAYRKPITVDFKDASIKQVFDVISRSSGLNILFDKDVRQDQKMSIILKNSTIAAAIHYALLTNQLEQQILDGNTILIYPNQPAKLREYQEVVVRSFFLTNAEAKAVANSIKTIVKTRDVVLDEKLNMIVLRDSPAAIEIAEKLVALHDQPEPEVMLEVEVLEIKRTRLLELGINWPDQLGLNILPATTSGALTLADLRYNVNRSRIAANLGSTSVNARKDDSDVNLLANPRIRVRNHEKAKIHIGEKVPNISSTSTSRGFVSESVNYVEVGLRLDVEPSIYLNDDVAIKIGLEVSNIASESQTKSGSTVYRIGTRTANTVLRLKDGETQVLAGLISDEERSSANKIPGLGDLPLVGRLFGSSNDNQEKTEIVLSITPRLVRNIQRPAANLAEFRAGTEGSMRVRPDSSGAITVMSSNRSTPATSSTSGTTGNNRSSAPPNPSPQSPTPGSSTTNGNTGTSGGASPSSTGGIATNSGGIAGNLISGGSTLSNPSSGTTSGLDTGNAPPTPMPPQLQWQGPPNVRVGETFTLQLSMNSEQGIASLPLAIGYDSKILQVQGVIEGDFLKQAGAQTSFSSKLESPGRILIGATRQTGGATGSGAVVSISFKSLAASDSTRVQLLTIAPVMANGQGMITPLPGAYAVQVQP